MPRTPSLLLRALAPVLVVALASACDGCFGPPPGDDGGDGGGTVTPDAGDEPDGGGGETDSGVPPDGSAGPLCDQNTPGFGDECGECGFFVCDQQTDELICYDPGFNDCGGCGDIDTSAGRLGDACGEHGCGFVECNDDGTATVCLGDHERNVCGGCGTIFPADLGASCSACGTGVRTCTRDQESLVCWRGRSSTNQCSSCEPCVQHHAFMDERLGGGYLKTGTVAVFEDVGNGQKQMVFLPLIEGPGANALVLAHLFLTNTPEPTFSFPPLGCFSDFECPTDFACVTQIGACVEGAWLPTPFAAQITPLFQGADPVRSYSTIGIDPGSYQYVMLYDWFLESVVSLGEIQPGSPPGMLPDPEPVDAGATDAGRVDAGATDGGGLDGGTTDAGASEGDSGTTSDGVDAGSSPSDAGSSPSDAGATEGDAGSTSVDGGALDASAP